MKECPFCNGPIELVQERTKVPVVGREVEIDDEYYSCAKCEEYFYDSRLADQRAHRTEVAVFGSPLDAKSKTFNEAAMRVDFRTRWYALNREEPAPEIIDQYVTDFMNNLKREGWNADS